MYTYLKFLVENIDDLTKAADPSTPDHILSALIEHPNEEIQKLVAANPNIDLPTLHKALAKHT